MDNAFAEDVERHLEENTEEKPGGIPQVAADVTTLRSSVPSLRSTSPGGCWADRETLNG